MKKYLVIGNPIEHSLSPILHNYWIKKNNIKATYDKIKINEEDIKNVILDLKQEKIHGLNVTVPFKNSTIPFLDDVTSVVEKTKSVNTIYKKDNKIIGHNTDVGGFERSLIETNYKVKNKKIFILGSGGVVGSIILALENLEAGQITLSNRTRKKAEKIKDINPKLNIVDWGKIPEFDIIINATSLGLKNNDEIKLNFENVGNNKLFYDVIYNQNITNFLKHGKKLGNEIKDGKMMFIYQAQLAFKTWHNILPKIENETIDLLIK